MAIYNVSPDSLYKDSFKLAKMIHKNKWFPDMLISIWRGGSVPAICISEYLTELEKPFDDMVIKIRSYGQGTKKNMTVLFKTESLSLSNCKKILLIDDVFDTGLTMETAIDYIKSENKKAEIKTAVVHQKLENNKTDFEPDFVSFKINGTPPWLIYPHEKMSNLFPNIRDCFY